MKFYHNIILQLYVVDPFTYKRLLNIVKAFPLLGHIVSLHILFLVLCDGLFVWKLVVVFVKWKTVLYACLKM